MLVRDGVPEGSRSAVEEEGKSLEVVLFHGHLGWDSPQRGPCGRAMRCEVECGAPLWAKQLMASPVCYASVAHAGGRTCGGRSGLA